MRPIYIANAPLAISMLDPDKNNLNYFGKVCNNDEIDEKCNLNILEYTGINTGKSVLCTTMLVAQSCPS